MWSRFSLRTKLVLTGLALQFLTLALMMAGAYALVGTYLNRELQERVAQLSPLFNAALAVPMAQRDYASVAAILAESKLAQGLVYINICDAADRIVAEEGLSPQRRLQAGTPADAEPAEASFDFMAPIALGGQKLGKVGFGLSRRALVETRRQIVGAIALLGGLALAAFSAMLTVWSGTITRPVKSLLVASRNVRAGNYDIELDLERNDELGELMKAFSRMSVEIQRKVVELTESEVQQRKYLRESVLRQAQIEVTLREAEAADRAKADFIANMSHEIRTPMNAIVGFSELLMETPLAARQRQHLSSLQVACSSLLKTINDVLDYSKMEAGQVGAERAEYSLPELVKDVIDLFQPQRSQKELELSFQLDPALPAVLIGDPSRLRQVLVNLMGNALKFTERGSVRLEVAAERSDDKPARLRFSVVDTGIGITPAQMTKLFSPFTQADSSITRRFGGTGLGLSICKRLVEAMGGQISVRSEEGQGSAFSFTVPLEAANGQGAIGEARYAPAAETTQPEPAGAAETPGPALAEAEPVVLKPLTDELEQMLQSKLLSARRLADRIESLLEGTALDEAFKPVAEAARRLHFKDALAALHEFNADAAGPRTPASRTPP